MSPRKGSRRGQSFDAQSLLRLFRSYPIPCSVAAIGGSMVTGWLCFQTFVPKHDFTKLKQNIQDDDMNSKFPRVMSRNEVMLRAMVQNAKESSVSENLDNAMQAQNYFMLQPLGYDNKDMQGGQQKNRPLQYKLNEKMNEIIWNEKEKQRKLKAEQGQFFDSGNQMDDEDEKLTKKITKFW